MGPSSKERFRHGDPPSAATNIRILPAQVVPMTEEDKQRAVQALATMIDQWWRKHGQALEQHDMATPQTDEVRESGDGPR
jgi:hypothetical protein